MAANGIRFTPGQAKLGMMVWIVSTFLRLFRYPPQVVEPTDKEQGNMEWQCHTVCMILTGLHVQKPIDRYRWLVRNPGVLHGTLV
jgi:hypothetical protein